MNLTVARLTVRGLLGRRRGILLLVAPVLLLVVSLIARYLDQQSAATDILGRLSLGTLVPILGLVIGTGVIATEIDDGSIVYLLAKPLPRWKIITTKLAVAVGTTWLFAAVPTLLAGLVLVGTQDNLAVAYTVGTLVAGAAYSAVFLLLGVVTRNAVVVGLAYALVWESLFGNFVEGARTLSIQQWGLSLAKTVAADGAIVAPVSLGVAVPLLIIVAIAATALATVKLAGLTLSSDE
ncbi:ABC-2 type transport system permease protein [Kitasatospora gansuensis]|uniref:ABC-2 type transport system permease protein n=1 Tax=Kitasatospora gansuensis TaxID=258050 RepID=A0A7W7SCK1_9ACTN|nr:ABC transporter permease subunit [Kitasatospora gansuensis]MBB4947974.1 ABC-2 type transport system permease protein [Kitasatospora gansuensis]